MAVLATDFHSHLQLPYLEVADLIELPSDDPVAGLDHEDFGPVGYEVIGSPGVVNKALDQPGSRVQQGGDPKHEKVPNGLQHDFPRDVSNTGSLNCYAACGVFFCSPVIRTVVWTLSTSASTA